MRASLCSWIAALALTSFPPAARAEPSRQLVIAIARPSPGLGVASRFASRVQLSERLAGLGLSVVAALTDGPPPPLADPPRMRRAAGGLAALNPFDLDPARVWLLEARDSLAAAAAARSLATDPAFEWVEFNQRREPAVVALAAAAAPPPGPRPALAPAFPDDPLFRDSRQWGLRNLGPAGAYGGCAGADIHALQAWQHSTGSAEVRLAIADTGIDPNHPDLNALLPEGSRIERGINVTGEAGASFHDSVGHGTAVAGVMAARTGEGAHFDSLGVAGVCGGDGGGNPGCRIVPIKIAPGHSRDATSFDIARAIVYATDAGARALNLSFAGSGPSRLERLALYYAITRGCVVVAASGNLGVDAPTAPQYPAAYAAEGLCVQVGASDTCDRRAGFSSHGPGLDLVVPGVYIWTTYMTYPNAVGVSYNGYVAGSGTSFAAPFVTGTIGLLAAARPELEDTDFQHLLRESADDVGAPGADPETGTGRLNAAAALAAVDPDLGLWHDEVAADRFVPEGVGTLRVGESGPGLMSPPRSWPEARLIEATATVTLPDSFVGPVRVWPRIGGTMAVAPGFDLPYFAPWADVVGLDSRSFTLRGYLYRVESDTPGDSAAYVPLPPDQARFGFTVIGRVDRTPRLGAPALPRPPALAAAPNPFRGSVRISGPPGARLGIVDLSGRAVRRARFDDSLGLFVWDGRDAAGRALGPGIYWVRCEDAPGGAPSKVLKLE